MRLFRETMGKKYKLNFGSNEFAFVAAKSSYEVGEDVVLYYPMIATDTNYYFYVDEQEVNPSFDRGKGYIIRFPMPEHDVSVKVTAINSMRYIPK